VTGLQQRLGAARFLSAGRFLALLLTIVMTPVAIGIGIASSGGGTVIEYSGLEREMSPAELRGLADAIVVAEYTGTSSTKWNSVDGSAWSAQGENDHPLIYRDDMFAILRVIRGPELSGSLAVRGVGGTADGVTVTMEGQPTWTVGQPVLLFLAQEETPLQEGTETAWTVVAHHQGAFRSDGSAWVSDIGTRVKEGDLAP
jgi:hypothetical protein